MFNWNFLQELLVIAMACSVVTVAFIQKTKKILPNCKFIIWYSFFVNMTLGILFSLSFSDIDAINSLWVGLFSFIGADTIYRSLEGKLTSYTDLIKEEQTNIVQGEILEEIKNDVKEEIKENVKDTMKEEMKSEIVESNSLIMDDIVGVIEYE